MQQLESRGLYDRRNPTGPLPTNLRPQLNGVLQKEGLKGPTVDRLFGILSSSDGDGYVTSQSIDHLAIFTDENGQTKDSADYYDFVRLLGEDSISWD
uniref:Uncharacterized protein n=1 Tax=Proboscia inermis TaxID=420281 RepID=A0A7S0GCK7_9STRA